MEWLNWRCARRLGVKNSPGLGRHFSAGGGSDYCLGRGKVCPFASPGRLQMAKLAEFAVVAARPKVHDTEGERDCGQGKKREDPGQRQNANARRPSGPCPQDRASNTCILSQ